MKSGNRSSAIGGYYSMYYVLWLVIIQSSATTCSAAAGRREQPRGRQRSLLMVGSMDQWFQQQQQQQQNHNYYSTTQLASSNSQTTYNPYTAIRQHQQKEKSNKDKDNDAGKTKLKEEIPPESTPAPEKETPPTPTIVSSPKTAAKAAETTTNDKETPKVQAQKGNPNKMWPPWPFNLLQQGPPLTGVDGGGNIVARRRPGRGPAVRAGGLMFSFFGQRARVSVKELQDIGSRLWFHLPPMTPPLILWSLIPRQEQQILMSVEGIETMATKTVLPLISNPLARSLVLGGFSLGILSWAHSELTRLRKLTPLPLNDAYRDIHKAILPHVLPDEVPEPFLLLEDDEDDDEADNKYELEAKADDSVGKLSQQEKQSERNTPNSSISKKLAASVPPRLQRHFKRLRDYENNKSSKKKSKPKRSLGVGMRRMRDARKAEAQKVRRMAIYDELVALQAIKRKASQERKPPRPKSKFKSSRESLTNSEEPLGYALVTGASRGIGRALAVELARWEIPLILVARDLPRLTSLAYDLEACYGVRCCVLQADLSQPHAAEQIHEATQKAGLQVDIVVNNAGVSSTGLAVDMPLEEVNHMIGVNTLSVAQLALLYGRDMKERRRGRILMVSSVVGAVSAGPTVALYAATKAFEKMLGLSIAKELEPYGVGVTCLMPGAVRDTDFRASSHTKEALCWKLPYYTKSPATVARQGIRALLGGDTEVTPGWQNRVFLKVAKPALPQRLHNILVEIAWNPLRIPPFLKVWKSAEKRESERQLHLEDRNIEHRDNDDTKKRRHKSSAQEWRPRSNTNLPAPLLLSVPGERDALPYPTNLSKPTPAVPPVEPTLIGQVPTNTGSANPMTGQVIPETEALPKQQEQVADESESSIESQYDALRNLSFGTESEDSNDSNNASPPSDSSTSRTVPDNESSAPSEPTAQATQQQASLQQLEAERRLLQLREETLKLQQKVQEQERKQFLEQVELDRRQREMQYEKRDMAILRDQQREERETSEEREQWRKRKAEQSYVEPKVDIPEPKLIVPFAPFKTPSLRRDLMDESLDHHLFAP